MACPEHRCARFSRIFTHLCAVGAMIAGSQVLAASTAFACPTWTTVTPGVFPSMVQIWMAAAACSGVVLVILRIIAHYDPPLLSAKNQLRVVMAIFALATAIAAISYGATTDVEDWRFFTETKMHGTGMRF